MKTRKSVISLFLVSMFISQLAESALIGQWSFEEGIGSRSNDSAGTNEYLWLYNSSTGPVNWVTGTVGGAVEFSGSSACFFRRNPVESILMPADSLTLSTYLNPDTTNAMVAITMETSTSISYKLSISATGAVYGYIGNNYIYTSNGVIDVAADTWQLVEFTYDDATNFARIYVNGSNVTIGSSSAVSGWGQIPTVTGATLMFGRAFSGGLGIFDGKMDEIKLYNTAIPEPATAGLLVIGSILLLRKNK